MSRGGLPLRCLLLLSFAGLLNLAAQGTLQPWGNLEGLRRDAHPHRFETCLVLVDASGREQARTGHYKVKPDFQREGGHARVHSELGPVVFTEELRDETPGEARLRFLLRPSSSLEGLELRLRLDLPAKDFLPGKLESGAQGQDLSTTLALRSLPPSPSLRLVGSQRHFEVESQEPLESSLQSLGEGDQALLRLEYQLLSPEDGVGSTVERSFVLRVGGETDRREARVRIDASTPGRPFDGLGGNFRLQFPSTDPTIIAIIEEGLRFTWVRTALWWEDWDPVEGADPYALAREGRCTARLLAQAASDAHRCAGGKPLIVSAWAPPAWARNEGEQRKGTYGFPLLPEKLDRICDSITAYLLYLRWHHGLEPRLFSFNEPDIGVRVALTPAEHADLVGRLGRRFASKGLTTRLLLADTSNGIPYSQDFVRAVASHPDARAWAGAIGFHTWGGCEPENLAVWKKLAGELGLPLLATETGVDSEAHHSPDLFVEPEYQLREIDLHLRLLREAEVASLLPWQLTADYSVFAGKGIYRGKGPLRPTLRFWSLQQLGETPAGSFSLPLHSEHALVSGAAFLQPAQGTCAVHLLNQGAERTLKVSGLPARTRGVQVWVCDAQGRRHLGRFTPFGGEVELPFAATALLSLFGEP